MKASELIQDLQDVLFVSGDLEVEMVTKNYDRFISPNKVYTDGETAIYLCGENKCDHLINENTPKVILEKLCECIPKTTTTTKTIDDLTSTELLKLINTNVNMRNKVLNYSRELQLKLVNIQSSLIEFMDNPAEEVQLSVVKASGRLIQYIKNPLNITKLTAVKQNGLALQYIKNPSYEIQLAAVIQDGLSIKYINGPCDEIQITAMKHSGFRNKIDVLNCIYDPSIEVINYYINSGL